MTRNLIDLYKDGDHWCAIYPMGSNLMECLAVAFSPIKVLSSEVANRNRDYGKWEALQKLKDENPNLPTHSYYSEHFD